jgi:hypothetical protein
MASRYVKYFAKQAKQQNVPDDDQALARDLSSVEDIEERNVVFYKYLCPRCTHAAYFTESIEIEHPVELCRECKLPLPISVDETRFIKLNREEAQYAGLI